MNLEKWYSLTPEGKAYLQAMSSKSWKLLLSYCRKVSKTKRDLAI